MCYSFTLTNTPPQTNIYPPFVAHPHWRGLTTRRAVFRDTGVSAILLRSVACLAAEVDLTRWAHLNAASILHHLSPLCRSLIRARISLDVRIVGTILLEVAHEPGIITLALCSGN